MTHQATLQTNTTLILKVEKWNTRWPPENLSPIWVLHQGFVVYKMLQCRSNEEWITCTNELILPILMLEMSWNSQAWHVAQSAPDWHEAQGVVSAGLCYGLLWCPSKSTSHFITWGWWSEWDTDGYQDMEAMEAMRWVVTELMVKNLSTNNQRFAFGRKSLEHDGMLIMSEGGLGEFTDPIWKQCNEWLWR